MTTTPRLWKSLTQVNTTDNGTAQSGGQIAPLDASDGGYVIVWTDSSDVFSTGQAVIGQRFDVNGNKVGGEVKISLFANGDDSISDGSSIANLHNGTIAVTYTDFFGGNNNTWVRVVNTALNVVRDDAIDTSALQTSHSSITAFANSSYVVSYTLDNGSGNTDILGRIVTSTGVVGAPFTVDDDGTQSADFSQLATLSNNNFVDVWQRLVGGDHDVYFSIYTPTGAVVADHFIAANTTFEETDPDVAALTGGGFVVAWTDASGDGSGQSIQARIYNNTGGLVTPDFQLNTTSLGNQNEVTLVGLADGGFVATWEDDNADLVRGQRFDATGHKVGTEYTVKVGVSVDSPDSALLSDGRIGYAVGDVSTGDADVTTSIWDPRTLHFDLNGDSKSDLIWRADNGTTQLWEMNGFHIQAPLDIKNSVGQFVGTDWQVAAVADFNADGKSDLIWRQQSTGSTQVWDMNGNQISSAAVIKNAAGQDVGSDWHITGAGDFDGDGKDDIVWRSDSGNVQTWTMNNNQLTGANNLTTSMPDNWHLVGSGDFDGDGKSDLVWRDANSGATQLWEMNGNTIKTALSITNSAGQNVGTDWHVAGVADFDGDSRADIVWRSDTGLTQLWEMNGNQIKNAQMITNLAGQPVTTDWQITATGDYNGDGHADLLWQNHNVTGADQIWLMNGNAIVDAGLLPAVDPQHWSIVTQHYDFV
ncbi:hypothetical protein J2R76_000141 [Bradyrhizobium sp. USDA 4532]|uniref:FG-GAP repeat domain-containing protein n=1 Tax=unclassified Bradyrhizobium TaxID=2631580 RepID=UPI0020A131B4|nr:MULTISPECIES: VCBS repeat-containing protein [unclassified Bradyrhizobium]MCP1831714.1 hypothetical protein [Bradyrhizobium sp. USDA 4545]MCP1916550.1 hypothetical protein [Bradyrhizobium sp. USDA 4532]